MFQIIQKYFINLKTTYYSFPRKFWLVVAVSFIDRVGGTLLFPFFALYITGHFDVGMTKAGSVLGLFSVFGMVGGVLGGALTDRMGRKSLILFGLVFSAISTLTLGFVDDFNLLIPMAVLIGTLSNIAGPAHSAMIADILPEEKRQEGFGIMRVIANMAWLIGPTVGGFFASRDFFILFITDAIISLLVAILFFLFIPETQSAQLREQHEKSGTTMLDSFAGYVSVTKDKAFMAFIVASIVAGIVYGQMYSTLSVYLRDEHGMGPQEYGYLMSISAVFVILLQFSTSRKIRNKPPFLMLSIGTLFYMLGFSTFGIFDTFWLFAFNIIIITIGEMINMPTMSVLTAKFAPEEFRGRYMAVFELTWAIPGAIGPGLAGLIIDGANPDLLWYIGGGLCLLSAVMYYSLHLKLGSQERFILHPESAS